MAAALLLAGMAAWAEQVCDTSTYPLSSPSERFTDNGDGTVTDKRSNLMWMRCAAGQQWTGGTCAGDPDRHSWQSAQDAAGDINRDGSFFFSDWRLPNLPELATIAERQCNDPRINLTIFPRTPAAVFWTATSRPGAGDDKRVYGLSFGSQGVTYVSKDESHLLRLVRTGP
jgi:hypothetical protein